MSKFVNRKQDYQKVSEHKKTFLRLRDVKNKILTRLIIKTWLPLTTIMCGYIKEKHRMTIKNKNSLTITLKSTVQESSNTLLDRKRD